MDGPQQLQPSLGSVPLDCQDTSLSMLLPVLDLALPAGKWAGEDAVLQGVWEWNLGVQGPGMPLPAAIPLILAPGATLGGLCTAVGTAGLLWSHCLEHIQSVGLSPPGKWVRKDLLDLWVGGQEQPHPHPRCYLPYPSSAGLGGLTFVPAASGPAPRG